jgi:hypothetical protein
LPASRGFVDQSLIAIDRVKHRRPDEAPSVIAPSKIKALPDNRCTASNDAFQKTQSVVGGVGNDTGIGFFHSMFALSFYSRVTQQLPGTGFASAYTFLSCLIAFCVGLELTKFVL